MLRIIWPLSLVANLMAGVIVDLFWQGLLPLDKFGSQIMRNLLFICEPNM